MTLRRIGKTKASFIIFDAGAWREACEARVTQAGEPMMAGKKGAAFFPRSTSGRDNASLEAIERARYWLRVSEFLIGETYAWSELIEKSTDRQLRHSIAERIEHMRARLDAATSRSDYGSMQ